jgi:hypothetical protein
MCVATFDKALRNNSNADRCRNQLRSWMKVMFPQLHRVA